MNLGKGLDFDDVLLVPRSSLVNSREDVEIEFNSPKLNLKLPIIASPMANIVDAKFAIEFGKLGGLALLHRFQDESKRRAEIDEVAEAKVPFGIAIGMSDSELGIMEHALIRGAKMICVDIANGYIFSLLNFLTMKVHPIIYDYDANLMAGNVATAQGCDDLTDSFADFIRVGIGSGGLCTTRNKTGVGVPQITAIQKCYSGRKLPGSYLVADGGIRNSGDAVKAFAFGADLVMIGSALSVTYESAHNGHIMGMASKEMQDQFYGKVKSIEGMSRPAVKSMSLEEFLSDFAYSLKSACSYLNCKKLKNLKHNFDYIETGIGSIKVL